MAVFRLELVARLVRGRSSFPIPIHPGEGWGHSLMKASIATHLLRWGYRWSDITWEYLLQERRLRKRADLFARPRGRLPSFWFECGTTNRTKLRRLRRCLPDVRIVHVLPHESFLRLWNGTNLGLRPGLSSKKRRAIVRHRRARITVPGVEYWALSNMSRSPRILFGARREVGDHYVYFETGEGWSLSHIDWLSRRTDRWATLIPRVVGGKVRAGHERYLPVLGGTSHNCRLKPPVGKGPTVQSRRRSPSAA
jgi:hypothetical protein